TLTFQQVRGYTALQAGLAFLPHTLVMALVTACITPPLMRRIPGRALIAAGALIAAAGFLWQSRITPDSGYLLGVFAPAVIFSFGAGLLITPATAAVTDDVDKQDAGAASGLMNTAKQAGAVLGLASLYVIAQ